MNTERSFTAGSEETMTIREMKDRKRELGYTNEMIARESGVPLGTVQKIFSGFTKAPRRKTILAIEIVLRGEDNTVRDRLTWEPFPDESGAAHFKGDAEEYMEKQGKNTLYPVGSIERNRTYMVREEALAYSGDPRQGSYTIDDYYALPDDRRVELIDGYIYDMGAPSDAHQIILGEMFYQLYPCVEEYGDADIFFAPRDVRLDNDNYTMVQPDLFINLDPDTDDSRKVNGAPDLVVEVLSPSNRYHDMVRKHKKYRDAGVREYWIIDPEKEKIAVYDFENDAMPETFTFQEFVPVGISGGKCVVDFRVIREKLEKRKKRFANRKRGEVSD